MTCAAGRGAEGFSDRNAGRTELAAIISLHGEDKQAQMAGINKAKILVVDDDPDLLHLIGMRLTVAGYEVIGASSGEHALECFRAGRPQVVITDLRMAGMDGHALFARLHEEAPSVPVIIVTAHGTIPDAVAAIQCGVFEFLTKPFDGQELLSRVATAVALSPPVAPAAESGGWRDEIVSVGMAMDELLRQARRAAEDRQPLLIHGPRGAGKTTLARAIHRASPRRGSHFVAVCCAGERAKPDDLRFDGCNAALSELIASAAGGTLLLQEIGALSLADQARVLPLVRSTEPFGYAGNGLPDVRVLAASSQPLDKAIRDGAFRADLYYAVSATTLRVPSLAERQEDIPALVAHFVNRHGNRRRLSPKAITLLQETPWPGNIRQLENVVEQSLRASVSSLVSVSLIRRLLQEEQEKHMAAFGQARRTFEREYLEQLLLATGGNVARAAHIAKKNRTEFYKLLARHGLAPTAFK